MSLTKVIKFTNNVANYLKITTAIGSDNKLINPPAKPKPHAQRLYKKINTNLAVYRMDANDIHYTMSTWALKEKWTPTQYTIEPFLAADPQGYFMLFRDDEPVASLAAIRYQELKLVFLGLFLVPEEYRNKGYSKLLWDAIIPPLIKEGYTLGLNASPYAALAKPAFYEKLGFKEIHTDETWRLTACHELYDPNFEGTIVQITDDNIEQVLKYDACIFGAHRAEFINSWLSKPDTFCYVALINNEIKGYIVASKRVLPEEKDKNTESYRIGPLYASTEACASGLLHQVLIAIKAARPVLIDIPGNNKDTAKKVLTKYRFELFYNSAHMLTNPQTNKEDGEVYGKTSFTITPR